MENVFKILVIDDERQIESNFPLYEMLIKRKGINSKFSLVSNENEYETIKHETFDVLMVDYNLRNGFFQSADKTVGTDFIRDFREVNMVDKIVFYSTDFKYQNRVTNIEAKLNITDEEFFRLINDYKIDGIVPKNNPHLIADIIEKCVRDIDPIIRFLKETKLKYEKSGDYLYFESDGTEYTISEILKEYQLNSEVGKKFGVELLETMSTVLLNYKY